MQSFAQLCNRESLSKFANILKDTRKNLPKFSRFRKILGPEAPHDPLDEREDGPLRWRGRVRDRAEEHLTKASRRGELKKRFERSIYSVADMPGNFRKCYKQMNMDISFLVTKLRYIVSSVLGTIVARNACVDCF